MEIIAMLLIIFIIAIICMENVFKKKERNFEIIDGNLVRNKDLGEWREPATYPISSKKTRSYSPRSYSNSVNSNFSRMRKEALKNVSGLKQVKNVKARCFR